MSETISPFVQTHWSLVDLFAAPEGPSIENAFDQLEAKVGAFEEIRPQLAANITVEEFINIIKQLEEIYLLSYRLRGFAGLWFTENTQNQSAQSLVARVDQAMAEQSNRILFFSLWWKALDDASARRLMDAAGDERYWLEEMRHFKQYTLSEPEEKIINLKDVTGAVALGMLYDSMTNRYTFKLEIEGKQQELTRGELMVYARHYKADLRERAYQELYRVYGDDGTILGQIYQTLVRDWRNENLSLRKFASPISVRNLNNDIPDEVVDTLLGVCQKNAPLFQRFFRLKAKWLGINKLRRYDIYAPAVRSDTRYDFNTAAELTLASFRDFDPQFEQLALRVFNNKHLDSEIRKGKRSGAFCWSASPNLTPWVLLNYQGHAEDVATMAHELGHAIHSMLAASHRIFTFHASLPLAETASTFAEMVLVDRLLKQETHADVRRDLLFRQVDDAYATIMRQAFFALFERQAHEMIAKGASVDELSNAYIESLRQQFGDAVDVSDEFRWEWVSIPHIYSTPFYVYAYAFGQLLVLSLYQQYKAEGDAFKPRYREILSAGGSVAPVSLLSQAGIDVRQAEFWQGGFDVVRLLVDELEAIPLPG